MSLFCLVKYFHRRFSDESENHLTGQKPSKGSCLFVVLSSICIGALATKAMHTKCIATLGTKPPCSRQRTLGERPRSGRRTRSASQLSARSRHAQRRAPSPKARRPGWPPHEPARRHGSEAMPPGGTRHEAENRRKTLHHLQGLNRQKTLPMVDGSDVAWSRVEAPEAKGRRSDEVRGTEAAP